MNDQTPVTGDPMPDIQIEVWPIEDLTPNPRNSREHSEEQVSEIVASIEEFGFTNPILADEDGLIIAGHGRRLAALKAARAEVPVIVARGWSDEQKRKYVIADNRLAEKATWDLDMLRLELEELDLIGADDADLQSIGFTSAELSLMLPPLTGDDLETDQGDKVTLYDRFVLPPMSVLDARLAWWMDRKRAWIDLGIRSEIGRGTDGDGVDHGGRAFGQDLMRGEGNKDTGGVLYAAPSAADTGYYRKKRKIEETLGRELTTEEYQRDYYKPPASGSNVSSTGTSIFDPVLTELLIRWFSPPGRTIIDPFAGGSVRGIIAGRLGREYVGIDLRSKQIEANEKQADDLIENDHIRPVWIVGDAAQLDEALDQVADGIKSDFILTCPPYADLEVYSDDPADLSTMDYPAFRSTFRLIAQKIADRMNDNTFAAIVVGDARGKDGNYYGIPSDTIDAFRSAGLALYNEAILYTHLGSVAMRVGRQFDASRKFGKTHQNVLIFLKGDARKATQAIGPVEAGDVVNTDPDNVDYIDGPDPDDFTPDLTPIERIEGENIWLKRDDLWAIAGVPGGKVRTCWALAQGAEGLVTAGSRSSPQVNIVAHIARRLGIPCRAHTPTGELSPEVRAAEAAGAEIIQHKAGYNNVIIARARDDAAEHGWTEIPFGMECDEAIVQTRKQVRDIPDDVERIVIPVGSGMSLAGLLCGLIDIGDDRPVLGVVVGADPEKRLDKYAPSDWRDRVTLVPAGIDYHDAVEASIGGAVLDPHYEAKCEKFLENGDLLWIVGVRATEIKKREADTRA